jgi:electron transfer flavoprotein beta subunit
VLSHEARPPRAAGTIVTDDGDGASKLVEFLAAQRFI